LITNEKNRLFDLEKCLPTGKAEKNGKMEKIVSLLSNPEVSGFRSAQLSNFPTFHLTIYFKTLTISIG
jgi:hypothetical protein